LSLFTVMLCARILGYTATVNRYRMPVQLQESSHFQYTISLLDVLCRPASRTVRIRVAHVPVTHWLRSWKL